MQEMHGSSLFPETGRPAETLSKKGFAEAIGVSPGRVSQLIAAGLPTEPNGRVNVERGKAWIAENVDPNRRRASLDGTMLPLAGQTAKSKRDIAEAEIARLKAEKMGNQLIDRATTLRTVETRARAERDAWIGWVNRAAPEIAAAAGGDLATIVGALDRLVRDQLAALADMPLGSIAHD